MSSTHLRCVALAASLGLLAGCGGSDSSSSSVPTRTTQTAQDLRKIRAALGAFTSGISAGDGPKACVVLTREGQQIVAARAVTGREVTGDPMKDCASAVQKLAGARGAAGRAGSGPDVNGLKTASFTDIQVRADSAQAVVNTKAGSFRALIVKKGSTWKVSVPPGFQ